MAVDGGLNLVRGDVVEVRHDCYSTILRSNGVLRSNQIYSGSYFDVSYTWAGRAKKDVSVYIGPKNFWSNLLSASQLTDENIGRSFSSKEDRLRARQTASEDK